MAQVIVEDDLRQGRLKEVLKPFGGTSRPFSLLCPANRHMPQRLRVLIDYLLEKPGGAKGVPSAAAWDTVGRSRS